MEKSFAALPDIDVAEELYATRMTSLKVTGIPGYQELTDKVRTALDTLLAAFQEEDRLILEDNLIEPMSERTGLLLKLVYRQGLIDGIKLMTNP